MSPEAVVRQPRHPDRRKPILVLYDDQEWINSFRQHVGNRHRLEIPSGVSLDDIDRLSRKRWGLVFMSTVGATGDDRFPLDALHRWFIQPNTEPVVVLSPFSSPLEARDSLNAGAIWYTDVPWTADGMEFVLRRSLDFARRARITHRVGSLRYQASIRPQSSV